MPKWVKNHDKWSKAERAIGPKPGRGASEDEKHKYYGTATKIYKNMGGEIEHDEEDGEDSEKEMHKTAIIIAFGKPNKPGKKNG